MKSLIDYGNSSLFIDPNAAATAQFSPHYYYQEDSRFYLWLQRFSVIPQSTLQSFLEWEKQVDRPGLALLKFAK